MKPGAVDPAVLAGRKVLVTGGAGFVGGNLSRRLVELGAELTVLDDLFTGERFHVPTEALFIEGDVADEATVRSAMEGQEYVFHLAARNIIISTKDPREDFAANIGGTLNVMLAARDTKPQRVVYTGSASVYGNSLIVPVHEDAGFDPISPYAASKLAGEHYCKVFYEQWGVPVAVVRYSNVFGPLQRADNPYCGVIAKFMDAVRNGQPMRVHGDGEQTRDFTYVDDAVEATIAAALHPRAEGEVFNIGTGIETSINELAAMVGQVSGSDFNIEHVDRRDIDNVRRRVMNVDKIRRMLRWIPQTPFRKGMAQTWSWMASDGDLRRAA